jgi:hypothetical protein
MSLREISHLQLLQGIRCLTFLTWLRYLLFVIRNHSLQYYQIYGNLVTNIPKS